MKHDVLGQALPAGLHIRLNMMTGEKEAKLLQEDDSTDLSVVYGEIIKTFEIYTFLMPVIACNTNALLCILDIKNNLI